MLGFYCRRKYKKYLQSHWSLDNDRFKIKIKSILVSSFRNNSRGQLQGCKDVNYTRKDARKMDSVPVFIVFVVELI